MNRASAIEVALLSPPGRGAIANLLISGPGAIELVDRLLFRAGTRSLADEPRERIVVGRWGARETGEEVVVAVRATDRVEVHCHGGSAAAQAIIDSLLAAGCRQIDWRQALCSTTADPIAVAAEIALASATTLRTAEILLDQRAGALSAALADIDQRLSRGDTAEAAKMLDAILQFGPLGIHLVEPWRVVLAGRPNVGKSSLLNALCGYPRAIVHAAPGTTRDLVIVPAAIDGWLVELVDTAGLHDSADPLEAKGMALRAELIASADLLVIVTDASLGRTDGDRALAAAATWSLVVANKCDLTPIAPGELSADGTIAISALRGEGISQLERAIAGMLVPRPPQPGDAVPFLLEHLDLMARAVVALGDGEVGEARRLLRQLRGGAAAC